MRWLDSEDQARLKGLGFSPKRPHAQGAVGRHRTLARGFSRDFTSHRPYAAGDEARAIDWKAYARLDRYYVREYRAEDRVTLMVLLDASASMTFRGGGRESKLDVARRAAAGLAWIALAQGDEAGLAAVGGAAKADLRPRGGAGQLAAFDDSLSAVSAGAEADLAAALESSAERLPRRAAVVVISDLMGDPARVLKALRRLSVGRRELMVLRVLDPEEREFPYEGSLRIEGLEGGTLMLDAAEAAPAYREAFARQEEAYRGALRRAAVPYAVASTDAAWTSAVSRLLAA
ncbi:MAG TPA: DUF58 domain-containing protein [Elusimicrobiota bacterium]|nr:DUF58 domain-containing protein [Elusimicrobiota bacterium]